jgi:hypothetical protein
MIDKLYTYDEVVRIVEDTRKANEDHTTPKEYADEKEGYYRRGYSEGYGNAIKDVTTYKIPKHIAKKFSIDELRKWENFEDEFFEDFCFPPKPHIPVVANTYRPRKTLKYVYIIKNASQPIVFKTNHQWNETTGEWEIIDKDVDGYYYKIGIATNVKDRLSSLQTGSNNTLEVIFKFKTTHAYLLEKACHRFLWHSHTSGEWFALPVVNMEHFIKKYFPKLVETITEDSKKYNNNFPPLNKYLKSIIPKRSKYPT